MEYYIVFYNNACEDYLKTYPLCEAEAGGSLGQQIETILVNMVKPRVY